MIWEVSLVVGVVLGVLVGYAVGRWVHKPRVKQGGYFKESKESVSELFGDVDSVKGGAIIKPSGTSIGRVREFFGTDMPEV